MPPGDAKPLGVPWPSLRDLWVSALLVDLLWPRAVPPNQAQLISQWNLLRAQLSAQGRPFRGPLSVQLSLL